jgi:putative hydrolase of the HAD superfamily
MSARTRLLLFDLGGVLADLGAPAEQMGLTMSEDDFWSAWAASNAARQFENGRVHEAAFLELFALELGLRESAEAFRARFMRWQLVLFPGAMATVAALRESFAVALLSNTNCIHWRMLQQQALRREHFDHVFLSYETGHSKPDRAAFEQVLSEVPALPGEIVFLDDSAHNVAAAAELGIAARQVHGGDGLAAELGRAGVVPADITEAEARR